MDEFFVRCKNYKQPHILIPIHIYHFPNLQLRYLASPGWWSLGTFCIRRSISPMSYSSLVGRLCEQWRGAYCLRWLQAIVLLLGYQLYMAFGETDPFEAGLQIVSLFVLLFHLLGKAERKDGAIRVTHFQLVFFASTYRGNKRNLYKNSWCLQAFWITFKVLVKISGCVTNDDTSIYVHVYPAITGQHFGDIWVWPTRWFTEGYFAISPMMNSACLHYLVG